VQKVSRSGSRLRCIAVGCGWGVDAEEPEAVPVVQAS
jgi:hypothetical protein